MTSRYIGQINAKYNSTDIIITPDRAAADQDGAPIVNTTGAQTISGAKTFSGSTTFTGKVTASNTGNSLKVANHDTALTSNDVLSAKDINTPNGDANTLFHRIGVNEPILKSLSLDATSSDGAASREIWFHVDGQLATWIRLYEKSGTRQLQINLRQSPNAETSTSDVYFNIYIRSDGTSGIATNLPKPPNW